MEDYERETIQHLINEDFSVKDLCRRFVWTGMKKGFYFGMFSGVVFCAFVVFLMLLVK